MKQRKQGAAGFTLVELVVVIAILGILAGVGTVAYTGYVKRANKAVDEQLFADIDYAVQLANHVNPGLLGERAGVVVLFGDGEPAIKLGDGTDAETNQALQDALEDAIPDLSSARLRYDWSGSGSAANRETAESIFTAMGDSGLSDLLAAGYQVGYADNAAFLWSEVSDAGKTLAEVMSIGDLSYEPGELVAKAAEVTEGLDDNMAKGWESAGLISIGEYKSEDGVVSVAAGVAACVARNYAFAEYVKKSGVEVSKATLDGLQSWENMAGGYGVKTDAITSGDLMTDLLFEECDTDIYSYCVDAAQGDSDAMKKAFDDMFNVDTIDTIDGAATWIRDNLDLENDYGAAVATMDNQALVEYIFAQQMQIYSAASILDFDRLRQVAAEYVTPADENSYSQAYVDGTGYYALMKSLNSISSNGDQEGKYNYMDESYLDSIIPYVKMAGLLGGGKVDASALSTALEDIQIEGNAVILMITKDGAEALVTE